MEYLIIKWLHILSSTILFGTGLGSAFYKWHADRSGNLQTIADTNKLVVFADWLFTTPTVIIQPVTGIWLVFLLGFSIYEYWLSITLLLYFIAGTCWLRVVWLQIRMRDLSQQALDTHIKLDEAYNLYKREWFWLGVPAFIAMIAIFLLMVIKPSFQL
ncbi:MAG: DUF2269 domain-containing protein [Thioalkalispiraceae bacterium]|jgi:uncharacterized membrane protein